MIQISDRAIAEIQRIQAKQTGSNHYFRLSVINGGCIGLLYELQLDAHSQPHDQHFRLHDLSVVIDPSSMEYLQGIEIDYTEDLMGGGFQFSNPQAQRTCGCGVSFSVSADNTDEWTVDCGL